MGVYDSMIAVADRLIRAKGTTVLLRRETTSAVDADDMTTVTNETQSVAVVGIPPGKSAEYRLGSLVGRDVMEFYIAAKDVTMQPAKGDILPWLGKDYKLQWVNALNPNAANGGTIFTQAYGEV